MTKRIICLILVISMLCLTLSGCANKNFSGMTEKELPNYPTLQENDGYTISGKVTDLEGFGLYNAQITVNGEIKALTDDNGYYKLTSMTGENEVGVKFYDYIFKKTKYVVNNTSEDVDFQGSSSFTVSASSSTLNNAKLFGVVYEFNKVKRSENSEGVSYMLNNEGKTTVTPQKEGFVFYPTSADVYTSGHVDFTAIPIEDSFTVSGTLNFPSTTNLPSVFIYVNGIKYTQSLVTSTANAKKATYILYGLTDKANSEGYVIWAGSGMERYKSTNQYVINSDRTGVNFDMIRCANVTISLKFPYDADISGAFSYYVRVIDENGDEVDRWKASNTKTPGNTIDVWAGCKVVVEAIGGTFTTEREVISQTLIDTNLTEIEINCRAT